MQFLQKINKFNFFRTSFKKSMEDKSDVLVITTDIINEIRNKWLLYDSPEDLVEEITKSILKDLRAITKP